MARLVVLCTRNTFLVVVVEFLIVQDDRRIILKLERTISGIMYRCVTVVENDTSWAGFTTGEFEVL